MLVVRWFRRRLLILSVSIVGFFISTFSAVLALDFTAPVVSILDGDTLEVLTPNTLNASALAASTALRKTKPTAREPSKPHLFCPT